MVRTLARGKQRRVVGIVEGMILSNKKSYEMYDSNTYRYRGGMVHFRCCRYIPTLFFPAESRIINFFVKNKSNDTSKYMFFFTKSMNIVRDATLKWFIEKRLDWLTKYFIKTYETKVIQSKAFSFISATPTSPNSPTPTTLHMIHMIISACRSLHCSQTIPNDIPKT